MQRQEYDLVLQAVSRLRPLDQEVLRLAVWEELSHDQVAVSLDSTVPADGLTMDDVNRIGFEDLALPGKTYTRDAEPGGEAVANPVFDEPSPWLVMCFVRGLDATDSAPAGDHPSAVFQVVGG